MHIPTFADIVPVIVLLAVTRAEWEVFNGVSDVEGDEFNLVAEHLIPAEATASLDQARKQNASPKTDIKFQDPQKQAKLPAEETHSTTSTHSKEPNNISGKKITSQTSTASRKADFQKSTTTQRTFPNLDDSDIKNEGFLLVEDVKKSRTSRKLTQFVELFSQDSQKSIEDSQESIEDSQESVEQIKDSDDRVSLIEDNVMTQSKFLDDEAQHPFVDLSKGTQPLTEEQQYLGEEKRIVTYIDTDVQERKTLISDMDPSLKLACVDDTSWECLMFREDYMAMKNLSNRTSGRERVKRQASSGTPGNTRGSQNMTQIMDCETGDCFSGNGTDPGEVIVEPKFSFGTTTIIKTNLTKLDPDKRQEIAKEAARQLAEIFKDVPGFQNVTIDPDKIVLTTDGEIRIPWDVFIDGGDPTFSDLNGQEVRDKIEGPLNQAVDLYKKNFTIDNQHPKDNFNATDAANQVQQQANDPCKMDPSPCPTGFGSCEKWPSHDSGIQLKCTDNCYVYPPCGGHGDCQKDMTGKAYCSCAVQWAGMYCDRQNDPVIPPDEKPLPRFNFTSQSKFNTTLKPSDLTPEKRAEIAKNLTAQLKEIFKNLPWIQDVVVDPDSIRIDEKGNLVIDWAGILDPSSFTGYTPKQIGDIVRSGLQNVSQTYRDNVSIDGQRPIEDFDPVDAADQVESAALNPCRTEPCLPGYGNCLASSPTTVTCVHNCNAISICQHGGTCQIDSVGSPYCQCPNNWSGKSCEVGKTEPLDGGEITGIALGGALLTAGTLGCCFWFFLARKSQKDVNFTNYTDEEGTGSFANPTSRLFVIDRPTVSFQGSSLHSGSNSDNGS